MRTIFLESNETALVMSDEELRKIHQIASQLRDVLSEDEHLADDGLFVDALNTANGVQMALSNGIGSRKKALESGKNVYVPKSEVTASVQGDDIEVVWT